MSEIRKRSFDKVLEDEPPDKNLNSEADIFIKKLAENQRNTNITLQSQLSNTKQFIKATELVPLSNYLHGTNSLDGFRDRVEHVEQVEKFLAAGLTERDVQLHLDSLQGEHVFLQKYKNCETSLLKHRLTEIHELLEKHNKRIALKHRENKVDVVESEKFESTSIKLMKFALSNQTQKLHNGVALPHSLDQIKEIEEVRFRHLGEESSTPDVNHIRKKARKLWNRINNLQETNVCNIYKIQTSSSASVSNSSKWDVKEKMEEKPPVVEKKVYTCKPLNYYTIKNKEIVKLKQGEIEEKGLEVAKRLSVDEIKSLPKFEDYRAGEPSKVLYLKNLNSSIKQKDLEALFKKFQDSEVMYRILNGRMRGQAFVTFSDKVTAARALEEVNGIFIKKKPVIIEFGKGTAVT